MIRKCRSSDKDARPASEQLWCLYAKDGKRLLGRHPTEEAARKQEQAIQINKHAEVINYRGAIYTKAVPSHDPSQRFPIGTVETDVIAANVNLGLLKTFSDNMSKLFDWMISQPGMEKVDRHRKQYDAAMIRADTAVKNLESIVSRLADKLEEQHKVIEEHKETIKRFQTAVRQLQRRRGSVFTYTPAEELSTIARNAEMQTNQHPKAIKHEGHVYVLANDEDMELESVDLDADTPVDIPEEEEAELDLLSQFKQDWQTVLSKLPEDLEVDEEFEAALNGIENFIQEFENVHDAYEEPTDVEDVDESEIEKVD